VKRYESGGVATNAECDTIYRRALERTGNGDLPPSAYRYPTNGSRPADSISTTASRLEMSRHNHLDSARQANTGMKGNPVHVVVDEGTYLLFVGF
jgi:hypothetical protein